jgi:serine/threonine protein kinase
MTHASPPVIAGRYQVLGSLGRGAMGVVFMAHDPVLDRNVAIKQMTAEIAENDGLRQRFYVEARAAARLNHPNIITIHELHEADGDLFLVMELLEGRSLAAVLRETPGPMPVDTSLDLVAQVCDGLEYAHQRRIVHRDIKPGNLFVTSPGTVKILDFGIARFGSLHLTTARSLVGTPDYMSPEQVRGEEVDHRTDIWAAGAVLYQLLAGAKPFAGEPLARLFHTIRDVPHVPLDQRVPGVPKSVSGLVDRLLAKARDGRPARAGLVRDELRLLLEREFAPVRRPGPTSDETVVLGASPHANLNGNRTAILPPEGKGTRAADGPGVRIPGVPPSGARPPVVAPSAGLAPASGKAIAPGALPPIPGPPAPPAPSSASASGAPTPPVTSTMGRLRVHTSAAVIAILIIGLGAAAATAWWYFRAPRPRQTAAVLRPSAPAEPTVPPASSGAAAAAGAATVDRASDPAAAPPQAGLSASVPPQQPLAAPARSGPAPATVPPAASQPKAGPPLSPGGSTAPPARPPTPAAPAPVLVPSERPATDVGITSASKPAEPLKAETIDPLRRPPGVPAADNVKPSSTPAVNPINVVFQQYVRALVHADADGLAAVRPAPSTEESELLRARSLFMRLDEITVDVSGTDAVAHGRRTIEGVSATGAPIKEQRIVTIRLTRRPTGWVITDIR